MAATTLQEFLVSVKYAVDQSSQQRFLDTLKRVATAVSGVAGELVGLTGAIIAMGREMATAGEQFYYMSQRLGSSVAGIQEATLAMTQLGASAGQATQALEGIGTFTRSYGPAAINFLRGLGVTAKDAATQTEQLGAFFRRIGAAPGQEGTLGYAIGLRYAQMFGINEQAMRAMADPRNQQWNAWARQQQGSVFGGNYQERLQGLTQQSAQFMQVMRQFSFLFSSLWQYLAMQLLPRLIPELQRMFKTFSDNLPTIERYLRGFSEVLVFVVHGVTDLIEIIKQMPAAVVAMVAAITSTGLAIRLATSPVAWFLAALTTLLLLLEDYQGYKAGKTAFFDWGKWEPALKKLKDQLQPLADAMGGWKAVLEDLAGGVLVGKILAQFTRLGAGVDTLAGKFLGLRRAIGLWALVASLKGDTGPLTPEQQKQADDEIRDDTLKYFAEHPEWRQQYDKLRQQNPSLPAPPSEEDVGKYKREHQKVSLYAPMSPQASVLLQTLASGESSGPDPYHQLYGGGTFGGNQFPQWSGANVGGAMTHAAGRYQFQPGTWAEAQAALGLPDFSPASQDKAAWWLAQRDYNQRTGGDLSADLLDPSKAGLIAANLHSTWTSVAEGPWSRKLALLEGTTLLPGGAGSVVGASTGAGTDVTMNQSTSITIAPGPTAGATATAVAGAQHRVNEGMVRNMQGALR